MGTVLVDAMAQGSIGDPSTKQLHPFFTKPPPDPAAPSSIAEPIPQDDDDGQSATESRDSDEPRKRRKTDSSMNQDGSEPKKQPRKRRIAAPPSNTSILDHLTKTNPNPEPSISVEVANSLLPQPPSTPPASIQAPDTAVQHEISAVPSSAVADSGNPPPAIPDPSKKVLKFNSRTGTLRSPPKPKPQPIKSRIVCVKYGRDEAHRKSLGDKITQILEGRLKLPVDPSEVQKKRPGRKPKDPSAVKNKQSFFASKPKATTEPSAATASGKKSSGKHSVFMSTPVSPRKPRQPLEWTKVPPLGIKSTGLRIPGGKHPLWPPQDMCHIRGDELRHPRPSSATTDSQAAKKSKGQAVLIAPHESVMQQLVNHLRVDAVRESLPRDPNKFTPAPPELRLPIRHFESGRKLQQRIRPQLRTLDLEAGPSQLQSSQEEPSGSRRKQTHTAISKLYHSLATNLSSYDRSSCEPLAWVQKYAPTTALDVLQAGKEGALLKQWLEALQVQSVDTGSSVGGGKSKNKPEEAPKKRRKKNKLDGFIVDSDDELYELDEVSDSDEDSVSFAPGTLQKTVVRNGSGKKQVRPANTILISGSHGSGKTAAVHAVAKELGFEIFEIHAGSRRSGKDILEKVGDMTRNHLVQQHKAQQPAAAGDTEDAVAKDIKSGKQGTMMSFFKPKPSQSRSTPSQPKQAEEKIEEAVKSSTSRSQKQSLILLEEVDILFEEDKQFWATLTDMIAQSKRPFIMTCNDEKLVPIHSLKLHGILRFAPPPIDAAVDLCLLVAANEGHALQRSSVHSLYESRGYDLRATLSELNYWCQIGVGDRKGGFDWFYLRWPKGTDLDENGDVVRVISEDTYTQGMGWLGRDPIIMEQDRLETELESFHQAWDTWKLDMDDWRNPLGLESWTQQAGATQPRSQEHLANLSAYGAFCDALSDADVCSAGFSATSSQVLLDPSLPDLPSKAKDDFITGRSLLEADPIVRQSSPHVSISLSMSSLAKAHLRRNGDGLQEGSKTIKLADEDTTVACIKSSFETSKEQINRLDFAYAFDPIAVSAKPTSMAHLDPSVFDQTLALIVLDVAPWVRGIVAYDQRLMVDRLKLSNLLSEGGKRKRMRKTRAAYSALEGGERSLTRKERYFGDCLNTGYVMRTGGHDWQDAIPETRMVDDEAQSLPPSSPTSENSMA
ncbi:Telomere length regulation protein elg1 [Paramyrothecium foliicola]|nr:Telomere length regulation protein elg1 [Paramyrothecium foliicola]